MNKYICIFFIFFCLTACSSTEQFSNESQEKYELFELPLNQSLKSKNLSIEFMQLLGDSRCPVDTKCFWKGNAQAIFLVSSNQSAQTVSLNTLGDNEYPNSAYLDGYQITLKDIKPYPATNVKIDPNKYLAFLDIEKKNKAKLKKVIIDVRTTEEFAAGHYPNARNLDYKTIESSIDSLNLAKDTEIYVYCRSGRRSGIALEILQKKGYSNVINGINQDSMHKRFNTAPRM